MSFCATSQINRVSSITTNATKHKPCDETFKNYRNIIFITTNFHYKNDNFSVDLLKKKLHNDCEEEFEDTKGVIRICISEKDRRHIVQKKKY